MTRVRLIDTSCVALTLKYDGKGMFGGVGLTRLPQVKDGTFWKSPPMFPSGSSLSQRLTWRPSPCPSCMWNFAGSAVVFMMPVSFTSHSREPSW